jgi:hypothetical protein
MSQVEPRAVTLGDLARLPMRANVAFAVRCAQRLRPCFQLPAEAPDRLEQLAALETAIGVATGFCQGLPLEAGSAAAAVRGAAAMAEETCEFTRFAGYAAVRAAEAVAYAEEYANQQSDSSTMEVVAAAFGAGRVLAANVDPFLLDLVVNALYRDLEGLLALVHGTNEDLGVSIDPSEDGPLGSYWPAGVPTCFTPEGSQLPNPDD